MRDIPESLDTRTDAARKTVIRYRSIKPRRGIFDASSEKAPTGSNHLLFYPVGRPSRLRQAVEGSGKRWRLGPGGAAGLIYRLLQSRPLRAMWQCVRHARKRRKLRRAVSDLDARLMLDIGLPPELIRTVLARRLTHKNDQVW